MAEILDYCEEEVEKNGQLSRYHRYFDEIKGISSQALDDLKSLTATHCAFLAPLADFVSRFFQHVFNCI